VSFNTHLGFTLEGDDVVLDTKPEHQVVPGVIHFAVLTTLAEVSAAHACGIGVVPASLTVNLMSAAKPGRLVGRGKVLKVGKRLATAEGEVTQDGKLVAKAVVSFAVTG